MPDPIFTFTLADAPGWARARLTIGDASIELRASYLGDALGELLRAVRQITEGDQEARASWDEEPGEWRWIFRVRSDRVRVTILGFPEWRAIVTAPHEGGRPVFDAECELRALVNAFAREARRVLDKYGEKGYEDKWIDFPFPTDELDRLKGWLEGAPP